MKTLHILNILGKKSVCGLTASFHYLFYIKIKTEIHIFWRSFNISGFIFHYRCTDMNTDTIEKLNK